MEKSLNWELVVVFYQAPNQIPMPWTIAIGNMIAPAIRKPHLSSEKHTNKWVNQAAVKANPKITPKKLFIIFLPFWVNSLIATYIKELSLLVEI